MNAITVEGLWSLRACPGLSPGVTRLQVAPVGHHRLSTFVDVDDELGAALGLDPERGFWPGEDRESGLEWISVNIPGPARLGRFSPHDDRSRALLVADRPSRVSYGARALQGPSGFRLASLIGIGLDVLLGTFETANVGESFAHGGRAVEAEVLAARARGRHLVVAGTLATAALARVAGVPPDVPRLREALGARSLRTIPHPSGRGHGLNHVGARVLASATLLAAALDARGIPHLADPWEAIGAEIVERCMSSWRPGREPGPSGQRADLRHLVAAWTCLGRAGVTWEGSTPGAGWRRGEDRTWLRAWDVDGWPRRTESLEVVPRGRGWVVRASVDPATWPLEVADEWGALLWAGWLARTLLGSTAWERRSARLAAPNRSAGGEG